MPALLSSWPPMTAAATGAKLTAAICQHPGLGCSSSSRTITLAVAPTPSLRQAQPARQDPAQGSPLYFLFHCRLGLPKPAVQCWSVAQRQSPGCHCTRCSRRGRFPECCSGREGPQNLSRIALQECKHERMVACTACKGPADQRCAAGCSAPHSSKTPLCQQW